MKHKLLGFFLTISIVACSSTSKNIFPNKIQEPSAETKILAPEWTTLTSGVYKDPSGKAVFLSETSTSYAEWNIEDNL